MNRHRSNPLITPKDVSPSLPGRKVECVFNTGVTECNGEIVLLLRVAESVINDNPRQIVVPLLQQQESGWQQATKTFDRDDERFDFSDPRTIVLKSDPAQVWLTSMSHLRLARSKDGVHYTIDSQPFIIADSRYEEFGCEDARITRIDDLFYINYSAVSSLGITTALATTRDFVTVEKQGLILCPDNRDVCFFPEKVGGRYMALTRPAPCHFGHPEIWICESPDMLHWGNHRHLLGRSGDDWDSRKSGGGAPFRARAGGAGSATDRSRRAIDQNRSRLAGDLPRRRRRSALLPGRAAARSPRSAENSRQIAGTAAGADGAVRTRRLLWQRGLYLRRAGA